MNPKTLILPGILVVVIGGYIIYQQFFATPSTQSQSNDNQTSASKETTNPNGGTNPGSQQNPQTQTGYKDGQYTGDVVNTVYGDVQVSVTISGGKITNVQMLKQPNTPGHTIEVAAMSFPVLIQEAIQAQSANVNIVSGATQNSEGFSQSLSSALSHAG